MDKSGQKPTFDRLIASIPPESLDSPVRQEESVISLIAAHAHCSPETLGKELGLTPKVIDDVVRDHSGDKTQQREGVVRRWIQIDGKKATLRKLVGALYHCDENESIKLINQTVSERVSEDRRAPQMESAQTGMRPGAPQGFNSSYRNPMKLPLGQHPPNRDALSTSASELSDGGDVSKWEEPVSATVTGEGHLETAVPGNSVLLTGQDAIPGNSLQVQAAAPDIIASLKKEMSQVQKAVQDLTLETRKQGAERDDKIREQDVEIQQLQKESETLRKSLEDKDKEIQLLTSQLKELQKKLETETRDKQAVEQQLQVVQEKAVQHESELREEIKRLQTQLRKEKEERKVIEDRLQDMRRNGIDVPDSSEVARDAQQPGELPTQWKCGDYLGRGSFGKAYICEDTITGRQLAVKVIPIEEGKEAERFHREVSLLSKLRHKRIVPFYGTETEEKESHGKKTTYLYIFMQYMTGGSLRKYLDENEKMGEALARKFTVQLLEGVEFLHSRNVVHRDIKGANILRHFDGSIKLADFGCSKELMDICVDGKLSIDAGTAHWSAPETCKGERHVFESDIWSVGATVVEMLTGHPPYHDKSVAAVIYQVGSRLLKPSISQPKFSREACIFLEKCFKSEYLQRPSAYQLQNESFCLLPVLEPQD